MRTLSPRWMTIEKFSIFEIDFIYFLPKGKGKGIWTTLEKLVRVLEDVFQISWVSPKITFLEEMWIFLRVLCGRPTISFIF